MRCDGILISVGCCTVLALTEVEGAALHVPSDYPTIQDAMTAATSGDSVLVAPGTYTNCDGGPCLPHVVVMKTGVSLVSEGGPEVTVLRVDTPAGGLSGIRGAGIGSAGVLVKGFTVTGTAPGYGGAAFVTSQNVAVEDCRFLDLAGGLELGAGIFANGTSISVRSCEFRHCEATLEGAGLDVINGSAAVENCLFEECVRGGAALIGLSTSTAVVRDCVFRNNTENAALIVLEMRTTEISGNVFVGNTSPRNATAVVAALDDRSGLTTRLEHNLFLANTTTAQIGTVTWNSDGTIRGNTFYGNSAGEGSAVRDLRPVGTTTTVSNNIFAANTGSPAYWVQTVAPQSSCNDFWSNPGGDHFNYVPDPTDKFVDPLFCDPVTWDLTLEAGSPCLPANSGGCGQIGAFGQGCGTVAVEPSSWARIKDDYR